jgi:ribosomal protein S12 methylthiotransferase accessory factor
MPPALCHVHAAIADTGRFARYPSDDRAAGFAFFDRDAARGAAIGEAVERICGNLVTGPLCRASWSELQGGGEAALDPLRLSLFSPFQHAQRGFPFQPFDRDLEVLWTRGERLADGAPVWLPASLVWVTFFQAGPTRREPKTHGIPYAGIAAGTSRGAAVRAALLELAERDATSLLWHRGDPLPQVQGSGWLQALAASGTGDFETRFFHFPSDLGLPVLGAVVEDRRRRHIALGLACRPQPAEAALKALAEAFQLLINTRILDDPDSPYMRQVARGAPGLGAKPWRRDRCYRQLYAADLRDAWDLLCHLQLYLDPALRGPLEERLAGGPTIHLDDLEPGPGDLDALVERFSRAGHEPLLAEVTTPDVRSLGLSVVRVIAPGLYGNAPAGFPYLGGRRLVAVPPAALCRLPMPYA